MISRYRGLYVQRNGNGEIDIVAVADESDLCSILLPPADYQERDIKPSMASLPDQEEYFKLHEQAKGK